jgi:hypothetical protein
VKALIKRVFSNYNPRPSPSGPHHSTVNSELTKSDIETYYLRIVVDCLHRLLVTVCNVEVRIKCTEVGPGGLTAYTAYVRILQWDPVLTPVLLQNMPVLDERVRKVVNASVILEQTHFAGLWFQASSGIKGAPSNLVGLPSELIHLPGTPASGSSASA